MRRCPNCRRPVGAEDVVCSFCDEPLRRQNERRSDSTSESRPKGRIQNRQPRNQTSDRSQPPQNSPQRQPTGTRVSRSQNTNQQREQDREISRRQVLAALGAVGAAGGGWIVINRVSDGNSGQDSPSGGGTSTANGAASPWNQEQAIWDRHHVEPKLHDADSLAPSFEYEKFERESQESETPIRAIAAEPNGSGTGDVAWIRTSEEFAKTIEEVLARLWTDSTDVNLTSETTIDGSIVQFQQYEGPQIVIATAIRETREAEVILYIVRGTDTEVTQELIEETSTL